ncbi:helix-turn-helix domain-containing protein [Streptomyces sp. NBC_00467]|uniref:helix-turn-helix domain-containing protein n=1 Tax=Streptomyces sp. NBC_00467 TaxID=2975752 RepID=UPI002E174185
MVAPGTDLAERGISLSSSQVYRLVVERPERLSLKILMALLDLLDCTMCNLIERVAAASAVKRPKKAAVGSGTASDADGLGGLRPKGPGSGVLTGRDHR